MRCAGEAVRDVDHGDVGHPDLYRTGRRDGRVVATGGVILAGSAFQLSQATGVQYDDLAGVHERQVSLPVKFGKRA